jgi:predicted negative regulator of RcsB-dependent stress response
MLGYGLINASKFGLVELILEQALGEPGHLPLLEFMLRELWEKRQGRLMHRAAYDAMGQLEGAIAARAEALFDTLTRNDPQADQCIRSIVLRLVRPGEGEQDTRRRAALTDFDAPAIKLIQRLADDRLLVSSAGSTSEASVVEVAHEALILHWARLREWVDADRDFMAWRQRASDQAREWDRLGRTADLLLRGLPLAQARAWVKRRRADLSELERDFIRVGAQRRNRFLGTVAGTSFVAGFVIVYFAVAANAERRRAELAREDAEGLIEYMVYDLRDALAPVGRLDLMGGINRRVDAYYGRVGDAGSQKIQRQRMSASNNQGNTLLAQGKLDAARKAYEQAQAIAERLAKADSTNTEWQRDLSVSYNKLGNVEVAAGKLDAARKAYEQALVIRERLAKADPSNTQWQRDLSVSYNTLGDVEVAAGKLDAARKAYEQDLVIAERLAKWDPTNATWKNDLEWVKGRVASLRTGAKQ